MATGRISRMDEQMNTSSAPLTSSRLKSPGCVGIPRASASPRILPLVIPRRMPASTGGVRSVPSRTRNTLDDAPSETSPCTLHISASSAPRLSAWRSARMLLR